MAKNVSKEVALEPADIFTKEECTPYEEYVPYSEPTIEEMIQQATRELEEKNNNLVQQLYYKEQENNELRKAIEEQAKAFEKTTANLIYSVFGPNGVL